MQDAGYGTATQVVPMPGIAGPWPAVQKTVGGTLAKALTGDPQAILAKMQAVAMAASSSR
jgi:hypothetical protein